VPVEAGRLERWVAGFGERHPGVSATVWADRVLLRAPDGSSAELFAAFPPLDGLVASAPPADGRREAEPGALPPADGRRAARVEPLGTRGGSAWEQPFELAGTPPGQVAADPPLFGPGRISPGQAASALVANSGGVPVFRALLVRRGGYACVVVDGDRVSASKIGSRHVQGRTAAGGWSQQRFARRREGQAQVLVDSATEVAVRVLLPAGAGDALVTGGDRPLIEQVLADPRLEPLTRLRRGPHLDVGDPKAELVQDLPGVGRAIRITLDER
jgi:hypothetical protein